MSEETPEMLAALGLHGTAKVDKRKTRRAPKGTPAVPAAEAAAAAAAAAGDQTMEGSPGVVTPPEPPADTQTWAGTPGVVNDEAGA